MNYRTASAPSQARLSGGLSAWIRLDQGMLGAFLRWYGRAGRVPSSGVYDVRRGRQHPWRVLAKRIREAREAGVPRDDVLAVTRLLETFVHELYGDLPTELRRRADDRRVA